MDPNARTKRPAGRADLERLLAEQRERWSRGDHVTVEALLDQATDLSFAPDAQLDFIDQEFCLREEAGEPPTLEEYLQRFPHLTQEIRIQLQMHRALGAEPATRAAPASSTLLAAEAPTLASPAGPAGQRRLPQLSGYQTLEVLGETPGALVCKARQLSLGRFVALKFLKSEAPRLRKEAGLIARLRHPHIVQVHEVAEHDGKPCIALEFMEAGSLAQALAGTPLSPRRAAEIVEALAQAVAHAHERGVVHRDLKPANVLLCSARDPGAHEAPASSRAAREKLERGELTPKIADFGVAKQLDAVDETHTGAIVGTPSYIAPEQLDGDAKAAPAVDTYGLGAILYELLTGRPPFRAPSVIETLEQVRRQEPAPPRQLQSQTPLDLETICLTSLRKEPSRRYATAEALAADLRRFLNGEPIMARRASLPERAWRWAKRRPAAAALLCVCLAASAALIVGALYWQRDARRRQLLAERRLGLALEARNRYDQGLYRSGQGNAAEAQAEFAAAVAAWNEVQAAYAGAAGVRADLARAHHQLGLAIQQQGNSEAAIPHYRQSIALWLALRDAQQAPPDALNWMGKSFNNLGNCLRELRRFEDSLANYREGLDILERQLLQQPENSDAHSLLGLLQRNWVYSHTENQRPIPEGESMLRSAMAHHRRALAGAIVDDNYLPRLLWTQQDLCALLLNSGDGLRSMAEVEALERAAAGVGSASERADALLGAVRLRLQLAALTGKDKALSEGHRRQLAETHNAAARKDLQDALRLWPLPADRLRTHHQLRPLAARPELEALLQAQMGRSD